MSQPALIESLKTRLRSESDSGKHAQYQVLPAELSRLLGGDMHQPSSRYEQQRFDYIAQRVDFKNNVVADIGCNMGFFAFSSLMAGAKKVICYEGTRPHAEFVKDCATLLGREASCEVHARYFEFINEQLDVDTAILLNVLHHLGDDYGDSQLNREQARKEIITHLNSMQGKCRTLIFQLGFNWRGDRNLPLFATGTKAELIEYVTTHTSPWWDIEHIGIAVNMNGTIVYQDMNDENIARRDDLGEFLNRPVFILRSKQR
ncbi:hypothetical protein ACI2JI_09900 [Enterobacter cancerogenus]|uniref:hypothetical protein n=1 Tax=Enterobacter cancerogenus TaxID=69218 RepID=UPI00384D3CE4